MRRLHIIGATALTLTMLVGAPHEASAIPFGDQQSPAELSITGLFSIEDANNDSKPSAGDNLTFTDQPGFDNNPGLTEEFRGIQDPAGGPSVNGGTPTVTASPNTTVSLPLTFGYDRAAIPGSPGAESGELVFTVTDIVGVSSIAGGASTFSVTAEGNITNSNFSNGDGQGGTSIYDSGQTFSVSFSSNLSTLPEGGTKEDVNFGATFSSPSQVDVPVPASLGLLGAGLMGLGLAARRRARS